MQANTALADEHQAGDPRREGLIQAIDDHGARAPDVVGARPHLPTQLARRALDQRVAEVGVHDVGLVPRALLVERDRAQHPGSETRVEAGECRHPGSGETGRHREQARLLAGVGDLDESGLARDAQSLFEDAEKVSLVEVHSVARSLRGARRGGSVGRRGGVLRLEDAVDHLASSIRLRLARRAFAVTQLALQVGSDDLVRRDRRARSSRFCSRGERRRSLSFA